VANKRLIVLTGIQRSLYLACDQARTVLSLQTTGEEHGHSPISAREVEDLLQPLMEQGLLIREGNSYLSLAIPLGEYAPRKSVLEKFYEVLSPDEQDG
jgi:hypothetical protein